MSVYLVQKEAMTYFVKICGWVFVETVPDVYSSLTAPPKLNTEAGNRWEIKMSDADWGLGLVRRMIRYASTTFRTCESAHYQGLSSSGPLSALALMFRLHQLFINGITARCRIYAPLRLASKPTQIMKFQPQKQHRIILGIQGRMLYYSRSHAQQ